MNPTISKLAEYFEKLPGIGPRQARRFVYALLGKDAEFVSQFSKTLASLKDEVVICPECNRFFQKSSNKCSVCGSLNRDKSLLLVIEKDVDLDNIEKAGFYNGLYYVLGGLIPAIGAEIPKEV